MAARAGIVVTGTEVLTGRVADRNGPWLAEQLRLAGVDIAEIVVVGDRPDDLRWALTALAAQELDLIITSGGLGPTADDLTAEIVADVLGRPTAPDLVLQQQIAAIVDRLSALRSWRLDATASATGVAKQARVPAEATVLAPVGTAPGLVVTPAAGRPGPPVVVLPGPPPELQAMWPAALATEVVQRALSARSDLRQQTLRLWGTAESDLAATLRDLGPALDPLEITTCLRDGELEIVTRYEPPAEQAYRRLAAEIAARYAGTLMSADGRSVDELVADALLARHLTIATAESCTAGMLAARLADRPGSSDYLMGGLVVYSNDAKHELAGVPTELIIAVGAVSAEVAESLAQGVRRRLGTDLGVGITGIAGPGGGTEGKPVGLVHLCVAGPDSTLARRVVIPGSRAAVRTRATVMALHLLRRLLADLDRDPAPLSAGG
jgi:nicotinamide-nucleotide amidase